MVRFNMHKLMRRCGAVLLGLALLTVGSCRPRGADDGNETAAVAMNAEDPLSGFTLYSHPSAVFRIAVPEGFSATAVTETSVLLSNGPLESIYIEFEKFPQPIDASSAEHKLSILNASAERVVRDSLVRDAVIRAPDMNPVSQYKQAGYIGSFSYERGTGSSTGGRVFVLMGEVYYFAIVLATDKEDEADRVIQTMVDYMGLARP